MERKSVLVGLIMFCMCVTGFWCLSGTAEATLASELVGEEAPDMPPTYYLRVFTNNGMYSDSDQVVLFAEVTDAGDDKVMFKIRNESTINCVIAKVCFDDGALLGIADVNNGPDTDFKQPAKQDNLPAGNELDPPFVTTDEFSVGPENEPPHNGINPGEWLEITFDLKDGFDYQDVLDQLDDLSLRIGVHVIAFPDGSSESAVTPEPATVAVLGLGTVLLCIRKRRGG
jgi:hypothetical protein